MGVVLCTGSPATLLRRGLRLQLLPVRPVDPTPSDPVLFHPTSLHTVTLYPYGAVTRPFLLGGHATPYPIGLVATRRALYLSYGAADSEWHVASINRTALMRSLVDVRTEAMPLATSASHTHLAWRLHFFSGVPEAERQRLASCTQPEARAAQPSSPRCADLVDGVLWDDHITHVD